MRIPFDPVPCRRRDGLRRTGGRLLVALQAAAALVLAAAGTSATAQYDPGATMQLGDGMREQMMRDETNRQLLPKPSPEGPARKAAPPPTASLPTPQERQARMRALEAEYRQRVRRDGKASADAWLRQAAYAMGQRDAKLFKQAGGRRPVADRRRAEAAARLHREIRS